MMLARKEKPGAEIFSPWYTPEFVDDKLGQKKEALKHLENRGDIPSAAGWNKQAKRRLKRHWDRLSDETKRSYQSAVRHFGKYLDIPAEESKVSNIVARLVILSYIEASTLVEEYVMWMEQDQDLAPNTINVRLAALRWLVDAARRVGWVEYKLDVKGVKTGNVRDTSGPTPAEFRRILRVVNSEGGATAMRDRLMVYMLAFMGLRISSVISLDMENIDFKKRRVKVKWKGKGDSVAHYVWRPMGPETFEALDDWLEIRGDEPGPVITALHRSRKGLTRLSIRSAQKSVENIGREASTRKSLTPHAFRHFHATDSLEAEGDTRRVMKSTGHTNIKTIEAYDDSDETAAREVATAMEKRWLGNLEDDELEEEDEHEIEDRYEEPEEEVEESDLEDLGVVVSSDASDNGVRYTRMSTGMPGVDSLLGGTKEGKGIVEGSIVLLGGFPGIGKSTLARQICYNICEQNPAERILYASGEETTDQIGEALRRLRCEHKHFLLLAEQSVNRICEVAEKLNVGVVVIDSVSTVAVDECDKAPGSVTQVKAIGHHFLSWCKGVGEREGSGIAVIIISHVDKKGNIAGPKALEHHVDAVYSFMSPSKRSKMRSLGCEGKNRFGDATKEIFFEMTKRGLVEQTPDDDYDDYTYDDDDDSDDY